MNYERINSFREQMEGIEEGIFFFAYENYLKKVETPYHKPFLENDIVSFFLNESNQKTLIDAFDKLDAAVCCFALMSGSTSKRTIDMYFMPAVPRNVIEQRVENLKKRFILMENTMNLRIELNALLSEPISKRISLMDMLCYSDPIGDASRLRIWEDDGFVSSSFILAIASLYSKTSKTASALSRDIIKNNVFPSLPAKAAPRIVDSLIHLMDLISSPRPKTQGTRPSERRISESQLKDLLAWTPLETALYCCTGGNTKDCKVLFTALDTLRLAGKMECAMLLALIKFIMISEGNGEMTNIPWFLMLHLFVFNAVRIDDDLMVSANLNMIDHVPSRRSKIIESSSSDFNFYGDPSPEDSGIAFLGEIQKLDAMQMYSTSFDGFKLLFELSEKPSETLSQFTGTLIGGTIERYKSELGRFGISEGFLLQSNDPSLSETIRSLDILKPYIIRTVTPDAFLLSRTSRDKWVPILQQFISLDLKLSNLGYDREGIQKEFEFPVARTESKPLAISEQHPYSSDEMIARIRSQVTEAGAFKPQLFSDINDKLVVSQSQFSKYLTIDAMTSRGENPDMKENLQKLEKMISSKAKRAMIKFGGKTLIIQPVAVDDRSSSEAKLKMIEYPEMHENTVLIKCIQAVTKL
ncbi:MAG: hypothetical protein ACQGQO_07840 [Sphaerochaetaceae bacterium]